MSKYQLKIKDINGERNYIIEAKDKMDAMDYVYANYNLDQAFVYIQKEEGGLATGIGNWDFR